MMKEKIKLSLFVVGAAVVLAGCGPDVEKMTAGLARSGMPESQAQCLAEKAADLGMKKDSYNYIAALLNEGVDEKTAVNKARRKFGADFKTPYGEAQKACVK